MFTYNPEREVCKQKNKESTEGIQDFLRGDIKISGSSRKFPG